MATTFNIDIKADASGATTGIDVTKKGLKEVETQAKSTKTAVGTISLPFDDVKKKMEESKTVSDKVFDKFADKVRGIPADIGKMAFSFGVMSVAMDVLTGALSAVGDALADAFGPGKVVTEESVESMERLAESETLFGYAAKQALPAMREQLAINQENARAADVITTSRQQVEDGINREAKAAEVARIKYVALLEVQNDIDAAQFDEMWADIGREFEIASGNAAKFDKGLQSLADDLGGFVDDLRDMKTEWDKQQAAAKKAAAEYKQLSDQVRAFRGSLDPTVDAANKMASAEELLSKALRKHVIDQKEMNDLLRDYNSELEAASARRLPGAQGDARGSLVGKGRRPFAGGRGIAPLPEDGSARPGVSQFVAEGDDFTKGLDDVNKLARDAEVSLSKLQETGIQAFEGIKAAMIDWIVTGEFNFGKMIESIERKLLELALNEALFGGGLINGKAEGGLAKLLGFAHGGDFVVGGGGGTDSQLVAFRATPGEHVTVQTPQQRAGDVNVAAPEVYNNNVVVVDPRQSLQVMTSPAGKRALLNMIAADPSAVKRALGL